MRLSNNLSGAVSSTFICPVLVADDMSAIRGGRPRTLHEMSLTPCCISDAEFNYYLVPSEAGCEELSGGLCYYWHRMKPLFTV